MSKNKSTSSAEHEEFSSWLANLTVTYKSLKSDKKYLVLETLIANSEPSQLYSLSSCLPELLFRDFITYLPQELVGNILKFLDGKELLKCCQVCRNWKRRIDGLTDVWYRKAYELGVDGQTNSQKSEEFPKTGESNSYLLTSKAKLYKLLYCCTGKFLFGLQQSDDRSLKITQDFVKLGSENIKSFYYGEGLLFTGLDKGVKVFSTNNGNLIKTFNTSSSPTVILLCKDCLLYTSSFNSSVEVWNINTSVREFVLVGHTAVITAIDVNQDFVVTGSADRSIKVWNVSIKSNPQLVSTVEGAHSDWILHVNFLQCKNDGDLKFLSCDRKGFFLWTFKFLDRCVAMSDKCLPDDGVEVTSYNTDLLHATKTIFMSLLIFKAKRSWLSSYVINSDKEIELKKRWQVPMRGLRLCIIGVGKRFALMHCSISCRDLLLFDLTTGTFLVTIRTPSFLCPMFKGTPNILMCDKSWLDGFIFDQMVRDKTVFVACDKPHLVMAGKWNVLEINPEADDPD